MTNDMLIEASVNGQEVVIATFHLGGGASYGLNNFAVEGSSLVYVATPHASA